MGLPYFNFVLPSRMSHRISYIRVPPSMFRNGRVQRKADMVIVSGEKTERHPLETYSRVFHQ